MRRRFWLEAAISLVAASAIVITLLIPDWIERVFGVDPDGHTGIVEWVVVGTAVIALLAALLAGSEYLRSRSGSRARGA